MTQNGPGRDFQWTAQRERAADLVAADELTDEEIAADVGVSRRTLTRWKLEPAFAERVREVVSSMAAEARRYAIGIRLRRVAGLDDRRRRLLEVIEARAADPACQDAPGGKTGLLARSLKVLGSGASAQTVEQYEVDTGLLRELREIEKQAAIELGQWSERREVSGGLALEVVEELISGGDGGQGGVPADPGAAGVPPQ